MSTSLKDDFSRLLKHKSFLEEQVKFLTSQVSQLEKQAEDLSQRKILLKKVDLAFEDLVRRRTAGSLTSIETLVGEGLTTIFGRPYEFKIEPTTKRNTMYYSFHLVEDGNKISPMEAKGGGVIAIISILLRIVTILISKPEMQRFLVLDESLAQLSKEYVSNAAHFFKTLGKELGFTILVVSHDSEFIDHGEAIYRIEKDGKYATVVNEKLQGD